MPWWRADNDEFGLPNLLTSGMSFFTLSKLETRKLKCYQSANRYLSRGAPTYIPISYHYYYNQLDSIYTKPYAR